MFSRIRIASVGISLLAAIILIFSACDTSPVTDDVATAEASTDMDLATAVVADLGLSADEQAGVVSFIRGNQNAIREPGFSWRLAAHLQSTLTAEQKERLLQQASSLPDHRGFGRHGREQGLFGQRQGGRLGGPTGFGPPAQPAGDGLRGHGGFGNFRGHGPGGGLAEILTEEQQEQAQAIRESYREQMEALRDRVTSEEISRDQAREQMQALRAAMRSEIEALLTDDQLAQLEEMRVEREAQREARREQAKLVRNEVLDLDTEGSDALDVILADFHEAAAALRDELRASEADRDQIHAAVQALKQSRDAQVEELLDETAFETFQIHGAVRHRLRGHAMAGRSDGSRFGWRGPGPNGAGRFGNTG